MNEILPLIERLGSLGILAGLLWWVFGRMGPRIVEQFHEGLKANTDSLRENTDALKEITQETKASHQEIMQGIRAITDTLKTKKS